VNVAKDVQFSNAVRGAFNWKTGIPVIMGSMSQKKEGCGRVFGMISRHSGMLALPMVFRDPDGSPQKRFALASQGETFSDEANPKPLPELLMIRTSILCLSLVLLGMTYNASAQKPAMENFLFIGNSFTFRNDLKEVFKQLAEEGNPGFKLNVDMVVYGGRDMFRHWELYKSQNALQLGTVSEENLRKDLEFLRKLKGMETPPDSYKTLVDSLSQEARKAMVWEKDRGYVGEAIQRHEKWLEKTVDSTTPWKYVSLQSWRDIYDTTEAGYLHYAPKFAEVAGRHGTKVIFYITSPYSMNAKGVKEPVEAEKALKECRIAKGLAQKHDGLVVPVPLAIYLAQKDGTEMVFRYVKDFHPNPYCAYLTACLFYSAVYQKSPEGLKLDTVSDTKITDKKTPELNPDGGPRKVVFTDEERLYLQKLAWKTMQVFERGEF
jgi:hypothetical protein